MWSGLELWLESEINVESLGYNNGFGLIGNKTLYESENTEEHNKRYIFFCY